MLKKIFLLSLLSTTAFALSPEKVADTREYSISVANRSDTTSGNLDGSQTFDRRFDDGVSAGCDYVSQDSSQNGVSYQVFEFYTPTGENADIEVTFPTGSTLTDSVLFVYCSFDPNSPADNMRGIDDDGGTGFASAITPADGMLLDANTTYYAVVAGFSATQQGEFNLVLGGDLVFGRAPLPAPPVVPAFDNYGLLLLLFATVVLGFFYWRKD